MAAQDGGSHVGCKANVIRQADRLCSGRRTCDVQLPEPTFDVVQTTCPRGLTVYLEVIYECLPGILIPKNCHLCITFFLDTRAVLTLKGLFGQVL